MAKDKYQKRREYVNEKFGNTVRGTNMSNKKKTKLMKKIWKEAKRRYK